MKLKWYYNNTNICLCPVKDLLSVNIIVVSSCSSIDRGGNGYWSVKVCFKMYSIVLGHVIYYRLECWYGHIVVISTAAYIDC